MTKSAWRPGTALQCSAALHVGAAAGVVLAPGLWAPALAAVALNHAVLAAAGLWPRSRLLGPNLVRLPAAAVARGEVAVTIDDGPDPNVTPRVLDILEAADARASFFCIGERAVRHPALVREIAARGHRVENHTYHHYHRFPTFGPRRLFEEIAAAQDCLSDLAGRAPRFFRAVAGLRNPFLDPVLHRLDLHLATWTRRAFDTRRRDPDEAHAVLTRGLAPGDIFDLHDGNAALSITGRPMILEVLPRLLASISQAGLTAALLSRGDEARGDVLPSADR